MLIPISPPLSSHSFCTKVPLTHSMPLCPLPSSTLLHKTPKPYTRHCCCSLREAAGKSAIQRISEKLRSLGYLPHDPAAAAAHPLTGPGSAGEIFIPTPYEIPKHHVGYNIDPSWSAPEHPVPYPGSGDTITRFRELWMREQDSYQAARKEVNAPSLAELMLPEKELKRLRTLGIALTKMIKVGKAGITERIVNVIHERWQRSEVVKIRCEDLFRMNMKRNHEILERKTGGQVVWRSGNIVVLYRGMNYKYHYFHSKEGGSTVHRPFVAGGDEMENLNEDYSKHIMNDIADKKLTVVSNTSSQSSGSRVHLPFVIGVGSTKLHLQLPGESRLNEEADRLLNGLGPRFTDWWGEDPLPIDGDLLPSIVPGFRKLFRLHPFGLKPKLTDQEATILRRHGRHIPCHFALGRNKKHQGLAVSIIKLWEKCEIAKVAIKRGAQNTNGKIMAKELKKLTGGTILSRDKYFIVMYRGKDFLPPAVSVAIEERRNLDTCHRKQSEDDVSPVVTNFSSRVRSTNSSDTKLKEADEGKFMVVRNVKYANSTLRKVDAKIIQTNQKIEKTKRCLDELGKTIEIVESDKEGISKEERYMLRRIGLNMKPFLLLGRRGVFGGTIENMHLHWKYRELVKIIFNDHYFENVESTARTLEAESGGILVAIERVSEGYAVMIYRGKNYQRPANLRPKALLNKREALKRSLEAQRYESLRLYSLHLSKTVEQLKYKNASIGLETNMFPLTEFEGANSSNKTTCMIEPFNIADDNGSEPEIENKAAESDFDRRNFVQDQGSHPTIHSESCASKDFSVDLSSRGAQSLSGLSSMQSIWEQESEVECSIRPASLSNKERLLLRKEALKARKHPVLAVGSCNILTRVTKTILTHFKKHPLVIVDIKGRAKGTSVQELVFELEQATGSILISREPNKIILYRGWREGDVSRGMQKNGLSKAPMEANPALVSHHLIEAIQGECGLPSAEEQ